MRPWRAWWNSGTKSGAWARVGLAVSTGLFFVGGVATSHNHSLAFTGAAIAIGALLVLLLATLLATLIVLSRHPELVAKPDQRHHPEAPARWMWILGGVCILLSTAGLIEYLTNHWGGYTTDRLIAGLGGLVIFTVLSRRHRPAPAVGSASPGTPAA